MWTYQGKAMKAGRSWADVNGRKYPAQWYGRTTDAEKVAAGWVEVADPAPFDNRFYWSAGNPKAIDDVTETVDGEEITTAGLKTNAIAQVKVTASSLLAPTDWMVVKAAEVSSYTVPSATLTYRAAVRTASNTIETAINGAADHAAFMALYDTPVDSDGVPTGNAPINDWPAEI
jgi:hypothetical protein